MYDEFNGETIVCIIDYKTGNPNPKIENVKYFGEKITEKSPCVIIGKNTKNVSVK